MGLPKISIRFESLALTAIARSEKGIVALILKTNKEDSNTSYSFRTLAEVDSEKFDAENYKAIEMIFMGNPNKVIVEVGTVADCLKRLVYKPFNYLTCLNVEDEECGTIKTWIDTQRKANRMRKAVLPNHTADSEAIINFTTEGIIVGDQTYSAKQFCPRIAGIIAGLPFTRSCTYYVLPEVDGITESETPDDDIDAGKLILVNDGRKIKIGRGVNSLTTIDKMQKKSEEFKKIKIVETMDLILEDIKNCFEDEYIGKVNNSYDNKLLFISAVNLYLRQLQKDDILDPNNEASIDVDYDAHCEYILSKGLDIDSLTTAEIRAYNTGSHVFVKGSVKPLDSMEDLELILNI